MKKTTNGFSIVELVVIITVIGILAAITLISYNGYKLRAQTTAVIAGLEKLDESMALWEFKTGFTRWPHDQCHDSCGTGGMPIPTLIAHTDAPYSSFKKYMQKAPEVEGIATQDWFYDNDDYWCAQGNASGCNTGDDKTDCSPNEDLKLTGVNIMIRWFKDDKVLNAVNEKFDGDKNPDGSPNLDCGKVRGYTRDNEKMIIFTISNTKAVNTN